MPNPRREIYLLLACWLVLNLAQAAFSPLDPDEAYYWMYARALAWGYFDHPPLAALLIRLGSEWLPGTLGLRLGHVLLSTLTMAGIWHLAGQPRGRQLHLLALLLFAQPMLQLYGFIATPDGPLLFGAVAFWLAYRAFRTRADLNTALLWGATMAFLLYAKYHGILVIGFTVLSNWRLWRQPYFYVAALFGAALFVPHLYWQYAHDFPTFRYHLLGRGDAYAFRFTVGYLFNQLLIFNPLLIVYFVLTLAQRRPRGSDEWAYYVTTLGMWLFFLWSTRQGSAEPHWTALLSIPLVLLLFRHAREQPRWQRQLRILGWASVALFLLARIYFLLPPERFPDNLRKQFDHRAWVRALADRAEGRPVWFENSYRNASLYRFYSGQPAWTYTNTYYRPNQYDLWQADTALHNRQVLAVAHSNWQCPDCDTFAVAPKLLLTRRVDSLQVAKAMRFAPLDALPDTLRRGQRLPLRLEVTNPYPYAIRPRAGNLPLELFAIIRRGREPWQYWPVQWQGEPAIIPPRSRTTATIILTIPEEVAIGKSELRFGWQYEGMPPIREQMEAVGVYVALNPYLSR